MPERVYLQGYENLDRDSPAILTVDDIISEELRNNVQELDKDEGIPVFLKVVPGEDEGVAFTTQLSSHPSGGDIILMSNEFWNRDCYRSIPKEQLERLFAAWGEVSQPGTRRVFQLNGRTGCFITLQKTKHAFMEDSHAPTVEQVLAEEEGLIYSLSYNSSRPRELNTSYTINGKEVYEDGLCKTFVNEHHGFLRPVTMFTYEPKLLKKAKRAHKNRAMSRAKSDLGKNRYPMTCVNATIEAFRTFFPSYVFSLNKRWQALDHYPRAKDAYAALLLMKHLYKKYPRNELIPALRELARPYEESEYCKNAVDLWANYSEDPDTNTPQGVYCAYSKLLLFFFRLKKRIMKETSNAES